MLDITICVTPLKHFLRILQYIRRSETENLGDDQNKTKTRGNIQTRTVEKKHSKGDRFLKVQYFMKKRLDN
ncbi:hypothetical protein MKW98_017493 [Papaver atlanticum]|uniref:Uncharacterized protein n=1 Tax=Papaver atlanticum TaxID=357466 RepID=A0AAD4TB49_9MAGN|nr:hypothetical protein MKW98_017493 [Papaver atlanticum]